tara:strand:+ start:10 stop:726 length:717 start_codon:yes stop_codon:yes gene_type:complete
VAIGRFSIRYGSSTGFGGGFGIFDALKGTFGLSDPAGISMARARDPQNPYVIPRPVLPPVAPTTARSAPPEVSGQSTRINEAQIPVSIPQTFAAVGEQKLEPLVQQGTQTMSLDLGNLLGTLGSQYISARYGGPRAPQVIAPTIQAQGPQAGVLQPVLAPAVGMGLGALAGEAYDFFTDDQKAQLGNGMRIDPRTGRPCKSRRRRKRLATTSDIKDLAALKSVLSPADLKTWIATHPS